MPAKIKPVLLIVFNKLSETQRVFNSIRSYQPNQFFIVSDGPRTEKPGEKDICENLRKWVLDQIDWECDVKTLFNEQNIGCGKGPSEAITWFFEQVEEGIILEDDCLPNHSFFRFCEENLEKYRDKPEISIISGNNFQTVQPMDLRADYYFSVFPSTWGWATWKRTWKGYRFYLDNWSEKDKTRLKEFLFDEKKYQLWWINYLNWMQENKPEDIWDFQFYYHCMKRQQLAIIPKANLVSNIGHGEMATHTTDRSSNVANLPVYDLQFPLIHPEKIERNYKADLFVQKLLFGEIKSDTPVHNIKRMVKQFLSMK